jgi:hypothetical protein
MIFTLIWLYEEELTKINWKIKQNDYYKTQLVTDIRDNYMDSDDIPWDYTIHNLPDNKIEEFVTLDFFL